MTKRRKSAALLLVTVLTCGCAVGPNYKKPAVNTPTVYRGLTPEEAANANSESFAEEKWWNVFQDEQLKELMKTALQQNYDLRRAGARILQAQAALGINGPTSFLRFQRTPLPSTSVQPGKSSFLLSKPIQTESRWGLGTITATPIVTQYLRRAVA